MHQLSSLKAQRGASVTSVILLLIVIVVAGKLLVAIVPAQLGDYQLNKLLAEQLTQANSNKESAAQFIERIDRQLSINADYDTRAKDILTFTNDNVGQLAIHKKYEKTNNFFSNVDIVSRFEDDITAESPK